MPYISNVKDEPEQSKYFIGFPRGVNNVQEKTLVDDRNLTQASNAMLVVDGVTRRYGTKKVYDEGGASKVYGAIGFYKKSDGTRTFLRVANARLQYLSGSTWTNVSAQAYTNTKTKFVQAANKVFVYNGTDYLTYYDGSSITTYTGLGSVSNLAVVATGTTGSTAYSYRVSAFNTVGETAACSRIQISDGNATLSSTDYNALTWDAVSSASGYNVYGRKATGYQEVYLATVYTNSYNDTKADTQVTTKLAPESDTTQGIIAKKAIFTLGRQFAIGVKEGSTYYPTRLYYSGTVNYIDSFNAAEFGGGWVEIYANDGGEILDIQPYSTGVLVIKSNGLFFFYFTSTGLPAIKDITRAHGGVSLSCSQQIENNIMLVGQMENRIGAWTIGTQANYGTDEIRTNEVTIFIRTGLLDINRQYLSNICSFYYDNKFGFAYTRGSNTENDIGWILDTQFGGWVQWDGDPMKATEYVVYDDGINAKLYGCSNSDGYMIELMRTARNDSGASFKTILGTKAWNLGYFDTDKIFRNPTLWFKYISGGSISAEIWLDGTTLQGTGSLSDGSSGAGIGIDLAGSTLPGDSYSTVVIQNSTADVVKELSLLSIARSITIYLIDDTVDTNWLFMGVHLLYSPLVGKPAGDVEKIQLA